MRKIYELGRLLVGHGGRFSKISPDTVRLALEKFREMGCDISVFRGIMAEHSWGKSVWLLQPGPHARHSGSSFRARPRPESSQSQVADQRTDGYDTGGTPEMRTARREAHVAYSSDSFIVLGGHEEISLYLLLLIIAVLSASFQ